MKAPLACRRILLAVNVRNHIIATGGSSKITANRVLIILLWVIVFLQTNLDVLKRVGDTSERPGKDAWTEFRGFVRWLLYDAELQLSAQT